MQRALRHVSPPPVFCFCRAIASTSREFSASSITRAPPRSRLQEETEDSSSDARGGRQRRDQADSEQKERDQWERDRAKEQTYKEWLDGGGARYKYPLRGSPNWLSQEGPFPMNSSFRPPTPLSDKLRNIIHNAYRKEPTDLTIRSLSSRYSISIDRINAIIKLKRLERDFRQKDIPLQEAFKDGMESFLGVKSPDVNHGVDVTPAAWGEVGEKVDKEVMPAEPVRREYPETAEISLDENAAELAAKPRSRRIVWEMVGEGTQPIVATIMEEQQERRAELRARAPPKLPEVRVPPATAGRPEWVFVDVGHKYADTQAKQLRNKSDPHAKRARRRL